MRTRAILLTALFTMSLLVVVPAPAAAETAPVHLFFKSELPVQNINSTSAADGDTDLGSPSLMTASAPSGLVPSFSYVPVSKGSGGVSLNGDPVVGPVRPTHVPSWKTAGPVEVVDGLTIDWWAVFGPIETALWMAIEDPFWDVTVRLDGKVVAQVDDFTPFLDDPPVGPVPYSLTIPGVSGKGVLQVELWISWLYSVDYLVLFDSSMYPSGVKFQTAVPAAPAPPEAPPVGETEEPAVANGPEFPGVRITETTDNDGVDDRFDNCPSTYNPTQADLDHDGIGDACDLDADGDGVEDTLDNCLRLSNDQSDLDGDGVGDACDLDMDGDGIPNNKDLCPADPDDQADLDGDGIGDACDDDMDGDGVLNHADLCPRLATIEHSDLDGDGIGDACDDDLDGDGILNHADLCPRHQDEGADMDGDGIGDACDADKDGDGRPDPVGGAPVEGLLGVDDAQVPGLGLVSVLALLGAVLVFRRK